MLILISHLSAFISDDYGYPHLSVMNGSPCPRRVHTCCFKATSLYIVIYLLLALCDEYCRVNSVIYTAEMGYFPNYFRCCLECVQAMFKANLSGMVERAIRT